MSFMVRPRPPTSEIKSLPPGMPIDNASAVELLGNSTIKEPIREVILVKANHMPKEKRRKAVALRGRSACAGPANGHSQGDASTRARQATYRRRGVIRASGQAAGARRRGNRSRHGRQGDCRGLRHGVQAEIGRLLGISRGGTRRS